MSNALKIGNRYIGAGQPVYVIAEIGLNHNGDIEIAKRLIDVAKLAGCDAVKFQKRTPELCVPDEQKDLKRETPWGVMTYLEYRHRVEFGYEQYAAIDRHCKERGIDWFVSCWDEASVDFIEQFGPVCYKIASASVTDISLLDKLKATRRPLILSTGMSRMEEIRAAVEMLPADRLALCHATSAYPCKPEELNLRMIPKLVEEFGLPVGYSGHEVGLQTTYAAVALGACIVERHVTLDRAMWGSDQAASVEPQGLMRLVRDIRVIERGLGDGQKQVYESEKPVRAKLRRSRTVTNQQLAHQGLLAANQDIYDRHAGQRCFILATGPSIKTQPLHLLAGETCISVSNFFVHPDYNLIRPKYHCVAPFHSPITEDAWQGWLGEMSSRTGDAELFFGLQDLERNAGKGWFEGRTVRHLQFGGALSQLEAQGVDLTRAMPAPQSVTIMALYASIYMGFKEIVLLGCDHDWIQHLDVSRHFYSEQEHALNRDGYSEWFGARVDEYCKDYVNLWAQYRAIASVAGPRGVRIINATKGGLLDVFPRQALETLVAQRKVA
ncbi:MAG TPA: N-acetylneuraminate synthase family protein [Tepidisphaeraceae bacterium]